VGRRKTYQGQLFRRTLKKKPPVLLKFDLDFFSHLVVHRQLEATRCQRDCSSVLIRVAMQYNRRRKSEYRISLMHRPCDASTGPHLRTPGSSSCWRYWTKTRVNRHRRLAWRTGLVEVKCKSTSVITPERCRKRVNAIRLPLIWECMLASRRIHRVRESMTFL
jgi:hypothetical protein